MKKLLFVLVLFVPLLLQGCNGVAVGSAVAAGVVYDHRTFNTIKDDNVAKYEIQDKIADTRLTEINSHMNIAVFHHLALLVGQAPSEKARIAAGRMARDNKLVKRVVNEVTISPPTTMLTRTNDAWITAKIKTLMITKSGLESGQIKVVTEDSVVYLMGIVNREQATLASNVARGVSGVEKVVKVFLYQNTKANS